MWGSKALTVNFLALAAGAPNSVRKHIQHLAALGLISIATRSTPERKHASHLYTVHDPTQKEAVQRRRAARRCQAPTAISEVGGTANFEVGGTAISEVGGTANFEVGTANFEVGGTANFDPEQFPILEQETLTRGVPLKIEKNPCDNPGHEHRSPIPGLQMCIEC
jgi:hypothetical protein